MAKITKITAYLDDDTEVTFFAEKTEKEETPVAETTEETTEAPVETPVEVVTPTE